MFERIIASILNRLLGEYVEESTFSSERVSVGIWKGYLVLEGMRMKKSLLDTLELPLTLRHGIIGRLEISIPWTNLGKDPLVVEVEKVFLVVEPKFVWDAEAVRKREKAIKRAKLAAAELFRVSPLDGPPVSAGQSKSSWGSGVQQWVTTRLISRILDSLQIHVNEVHVRYEDHLSHPTVPFYVGVTVDSLRVGPADQARRSQSRLSTDSLEGGLATGYGGGDRGASSDGDTVARSLSVGVSDAGTSESEDGVGKGYRLVKKLLQLSRLAVYWNPEEDGNPCSMHLSEIPVEQAQAVLSRLIASGYGDVMDGRERSMGNDGRLRHHYILRPLDATCRVELNPDPRDRSQPRLHAQVEIGRVSAQLEDFQLRNGMCLGATMAQYVEVGKYSKYRPEVPVREDPASWWHYAFAVIVEKIRARTGGRRFRDVVERRKLRMEYMPLWIKCTRRSQDGVFAANVNSASIETSPPHRTRFSLAGPSNVEQSPGSVSESTTSSADWRSSLGADDFADAEEAPVWPMPLDGTRRTSRGGSWARADALADKKRLEELEDLLSVEDIVVFRTMAERATQGDSVPRGLGGSRWSLGRMVKWAIGAEKGTSPVGEEDQAVPDDDELRRLFTALDYESSRAPASPSVGGKGVTGRERVRGWVALTLDIRATESSLVLASFRDSGLKRQALSLTKHAEARPFMEACFKAFSVSVGVHGEDMDGIDAVVALDDFAVYGLNPGSTHDWRAGDSDRGYGVGVGDADGDPAVGRSRVLTRRVPSPSLSRGADGAAEGPLARRWYSLSATGPSPLFEMRVERNPRDPDYDIKVHLAVDQVETVLSPAAPWLERIIAFAQPPDELEHWATLELAATNQLKNLRAQLESRLEMIMSDRFRVFLDMHVKAPRLVVPVDVRMATSTRLGEGYGKEHGSFAARDRGVPERKVGDGSGNEPGERRHGETASGSSAEAVTGMRESLVIDVGGVSLSTARLAHLRNYGRDRDENASSGGEKDADREGMGDEAKAGFPGERGRPRDRQPPSTASGRRRARASSSVGSTGEPGGKRWHSHFYDVYNIEVTRIAAQLVRGLRGYGVEASEGEGRAMGIPSGLGTGSTPTSAAALLDVPPGGCLVRPFNIKVELHSSVLADDPSISQFKVYGGLSDLYLRLSQDNLERLAGMSAAVVAQSAVLKSKREAASARNARKSTGLEKRGIEEVVGRRRSVGDGNSGGGNNRGSLKSFLEFQKTLNKRLDNILQGDGPAISLRGVEPGDPGGLSVRSGQGRSRWGDNGYGGSSSGAGGGIDGADAAVSSMGEGDDFLSPWEGDAWGDSFHGSKRGSGRSRASSMARSFRSVSQHSLSGESEFCDADDGGVSFAETPETPSSAWLAARMVEGAPGEPQAGEDAGTRGENWLPESRSHAEQRAGGPNFEDDGSEDDSLGFEDARDPISELDEALMAKEAEKAELMKRRQRLRDELSRGRRVGDEAEAIRAEANDVSRRLEACEDDLKDLGAALERLTETLGDVEGHNAILPLDTGGGGFLSPAAGRGAYDRAEETPPSFPGEGWSPSQFYAPRVRRTPSASSSSDRGVFTSMSRGTSASSVAAGVNREIVMCGVTIPLVKVDLLRRRTSDAAAPRAGPEAPIALGMVEGKRSEVAGTEEEEKVLSLRLVGMGVQLHSKSYGARFSFSLQDLDLEDCMREVPRRPRAMGGDSRVRADVSVGPTPEEEGVFSYAAEEVMPRSGSDDEVGNMMTSSPRLCLWHRVYDGRRAVTFREVGRAGGGDRGGESGPGGCDEGRVYEAKRGYDAARDEETSGRRPELGGRPDFVQISYALSTTPGGSTRGKRVGGRRRALRAARPQEAHRIKVLVGEAEVSLEQATIVVILDMFRSVARRFEGPFTGGGGGRDSFGTSTDSRTSASGTAGARAGSSDAAGVVSGGRDTGDGVGMPTLPDGVTTVAFDVTAVCVGLTHRGVHVAAMTISTAHFKLNAECDRAKAVASLGDFSVLNLLGPSKDAHRFGSSSAAVANGSSFLPTLGRKAALSSDGGSGRVPGSGRRQENVGFDCIDYVVGRRTGASGPVLDVALVVVPSGDIGPVRGSSVGDKGLEARVRFRLDNIRAVLSTSFAENVTRYIATGPLLSELARTDVGDLGRGSDVGAVPGFGPAVSPPRTSGSDFAAPAPSYVAVELPAGVEEEGEESKVASGSGRTREVRRGDASASGEVEHAAGGGRGKRDASGGPGGTSPWMPFAMVKVGLEVSRPILELHLGDSGTIDGVSAGVEHFLVAAEWMPLASDEGNNEGGGKGYPSLLRMESLVSSAAVASNPDGFSLLEETHIRAAAVVPLLGTGFDIGSGWTGVTTHTDPFPKSERDELGEKARATGNRGVVALPLRPVLRGTQESTSGSTGGILPRPQIAVTTTPLSFNLSNRHVVELSCSAMDVFKWLKHMSDLSPPNKPVSIVSTDRTKARAAERRDGTAGPTTGREVGNGVAEGEPPPRFGRMSEEGLPAEVSGSADPSFSPAETPADSAQASVTNEIVSSSWLSTPLPGSMAQVASSGFDSTMSGPGAEIALPSRQTDPGLRHGLSSLYPSRPPEAAQALPRGEDRLGFGGAKGRVPQAVPSGERKVTEEGDVLALPPLLMSIVIDGISFTLLMEDRSSSDEERIAKGGFGEANHVPPTSGTRVSSAPASGMPSSSASRMLRRASQPEASESTPARTYSPLLLLDVRSIGVGIDLAGSATRSNVQPVSGTSTRDPGIQHRVEVAIRRITLMDRKACRQNTLVRLLGGSVKQSDPRSGDARIREPRGVGSRASSERILPVFWWCVTPNGREEEEEEEPRGVADGAGSYDEQVLVQARLCPLTNAASVEAEVSSVHLMLLPCPILDLMNLVTEIEQEYAQRVSSDDGAVPGRADVGRGPVADAAIFSVEEAGVGESPEARSQPREGMRVSVGYEGAGEPDRIHLLGAPVAGIGEGMRGGREATARARRLPGSSVLPRGEGRRDSSFRTQNSLADLTQHLREARSDQDSNDLRQVLKILLSSIPDVSWLQRIECAVSVQGVQLWLPDLDASLASPDRKAVPYDSPGETKASAPEAIVLAADCFVSVLVTSPLGADSSPSVNADSPAANASTDTFGPEHSPPYEAETEPVGVSPGAGVVNEISEMKVDFQAVEVFVSHPSIEEFGAPVAPVKGSSGDDGRRHARVAIDHARPEVPRRDTPEGGNAQEDPTGHRVEGAFAAGASRDISLASTHGGRGLVGLSGDTRVRGAARSSIGALGSDGVRGRHWPSDAVKIHRFILPFSVKLTHALFFERFSNASSLRSELELTVSQIEVCDLLRFLLAARVVASAVAPLVGESPPFGDDGRRPGEVHEEGLAGGASGSPLAEQSLGNLGAGRNGRPRPDLRAAGRPVGLEVDRLASLDGANGGHSRGDASSEVRGDSRVAATGEAEAVVTGASPLERGTGETSLLLLVLTSVWQGHAKFDIAGVKLTLVNNVHRQSRPGVNVDVRLVTGEVLVSGSSRSIQASLTTTLASNFYNARVKAWEPLVEPWKVRLELEAGLNLPRVPQDVEELPSRTTRVYDGAGRGWDSSEPAPGTFGTSQRVIDLDEERRPGDCDRLAVRLMVVSDTLLNLNVTESVIESLAATTLAAGGPQEHAERVLRLKAVGHRRDVGDVGDGSDDFPAYWIRNETGYPIVCSACGDFAHRGRDRQDGEWIATPVQLDAGEERPLPLPRFVLTSADATGDGGHGAVVGDGRVPSSPAGYRDATTRRTNSDLRDPGGEDPFATQGRGHHAAVARGNRASTMAPRSPSMEPPRRRVPRLVNLELEYQRETVPGGRTLWRSQRPVEADVVGQQVATMVAWSMSPKPPPVSRAGFSSGGKPGDDCASAGRFDAVKSTRTAKIVTEVEDHDGVKVMRLRSRLEIVNRMGNRVTMHVGFLSDSSSARRGRRGGGNAGEDARFDWEAEVPPGETRSMSALMAALAAAGQGVLVVKPILRGWRDAEFERTDVLGGGGSSSHLPPASPSPTTYKEVLLTLPQASKWEVARDLRYNRVLEFLAEVVGHGDDSSPVFCGVNIGPQGIGKSGKGGGSRRRGTVGGGVSVLVLSFEPPVSVTNLLAGPADVRLACPALVPDLMMGRSRMTNARGSLRRTVPRGTGVSWLKCPPHEEVTMAVRLTNFGWSEEVTLTMPSKAGEEDEEATEAYGTELSLSKGLGRLSPRAAPGQREWVPSPRIGRRKGRGTWLNCPHHAEITLRDPQNAPLRVNVEVLFSTSGLRQVSIWVPFWLVNMTSLPVLLQHDPSSLGINHKGPPGDEAAIAGQLHWAGPEGGWGAYAQGADRSSWVRSGNRGRRRGVESGPRIQLSAAGEAGEWGAEDDRGSGALGRQQTVTVGVVHYDDDSDEQRLVPLMVPYTNPDRKQGRLRVRLEGSAWSKPFGIDQPGMSHELEVRGKPALPDQERVVLPPGKKVNRRRPPRPRPQRRAFVIGAHVVAAPGLFHRTKVVTLAPRLIIVNTIGQGLEVQQARVDGNTEVLKVPNGAKTAFFWPEAGSGGWFGGSPGRRRLVARVSNAGWRWSGEFSPDSTVDVTLRLRKPRSRGVAYVRVKALLKGASVYLVFSRELPSFAPYRIENLTQETLTLKQVGVNIVETLHPGGALVYSWDEPLGERSVVIERLTRAPSGLGVGVGLAETAASGQQSARSFTAGSTVVGVYALDITRPSSIVGGLRVDMTSDGPTRCLRFSETPAASASATSLGSSLMSHGASGDEGGNGGAGRDPRQLVLDASVRLHGVGISVINACPRELLYLTVSEISLSYLREGQEEHVRASATKLQIDNQLDVTLYPILLYPIPEALPPRHPSIVPLPRSTVPVFPSMASGRRRRRARSSSQGQGTEACFEVIVRRGIGYPWVNYVRLVSLRVAPLDVNLDGALIEAMLEMGARAMDRFEDKAGAEERVAFSSASPAAFDTNRGVSYPSVQLDGTVSVRAIAEATGGKSDRVYLEELAISPIRLHVSFTATSGGALRGRLESSDQLLQSGTGILGITEGMGAATTAARSLLRGMGTTLTLIENAPLLLNSLVVSQRFSSPEELLQNILAHYKVQGVRQLPKIMGSSDLLGNPVGLLLNMSTGVKDFFYEPLRGLTRSPFGFATGVVKGTSSLVQRTLYSFTDTVDRIVTSVSSGILASGSVDVVVRGGRGVVRPYGALDGIMLGFAGAFLEPLAGFHGGGISGMTVGLFTGWVGLVLRPMYGALMSTSQICQAVSGYLDPRLDSQQKMRMLRARPPRFFRSSEQALNVYSREENTGEEMLSRVKMGRYRSDGYVWHTAIKDMIVLVTGRRLLMLYGPAAGVGGLSSGGRSGVGHNYCRVDWEVEFGLVVLVEIDQDPRVPRGLPPSSFAVNVAAYGELQRPVNNQDLRRVGGGSTRQDHELGEGGSVVSVYHLPDASQGERGNNEEGGYLEDRGVVAFKFERKRLACADPAHAQQLHRVLVAQVPALASSGAAESSALGPQPTS